MGKAVSVTGGVVVLALAYVGSSWWLGQQAEKHYQTDFDKIVKRMGFDEVKRVGYTRGIFESQATDILTLVLPRPPQGMGDDDQDDSGEDITLRLHLVQTIKHGPFVGSRLAAARIETRLDKVEGVPEGLKQALAKASAPTASTLVGFDGSMDGQAVLPAGEMVPPGSEPDNRMTWKQLTYDYMVSGDRLQVLAQLQWPELTWSVTPGAFGPDKPGMHLVMSGLSANIQQTGTNPDHWLMVPGNYTLRLNDFQLKTVSKDGKQPSTLFSVNGWESQGRITSSGKLLASEENGAGKAVVMDVPLEKLGYTASISNIDEAVLVPLQDIVQEMGKATDPADAMPDEARLRPVVTTLAASSPALGMRLDGTLQGKTAYVDSRVVLNPLQGSASVPLGPQLLQTLKADVNVYLPKTITSEVNRRLEQSFGKDANGCNLDCQLRHQGIAREQADAWETKVQFAGGQLMLNGQRIF